MKETKAHSPRRLIIGGHNVEKLRYPYYVSIDKNNGVIVSGALIAPDIVLTAGHVMLDHMENLTIKVGPFAPRIEEDFSETIPIQRSILHPEWNATSAGLFRNDFLILQLTNTSSHEPIRMNSNPNIPENGAHVIIMGLGWTTSTMTSPSMYVQEAKLDYVNTTQCAMAHDYLRGIYYAGQIDDSMFCTKSPPNTTRDGCAWDSGDPVILAGETAADDLLVGLGSSGIECADPIFPGTQARVSNGFEWIIDTVCQISVDPPSDFHCNKTVQPPTVLLTNDTSEEPLYLADLTALRPVLVLKQEHSLATASLLILCGIALVVGVALKRMRMRPIRDLSRTLTHAPRRPMYGSTN